MGKTKSRLNNNEEEDSILSENCSENWKTTQIEQHQYKGSKAQYIPARKEPMQYQTHKKTLSHHPARDDSGH